MNYRLLALVAALLTACSQETPQVPSQDVRHAAKSVPAAFVEKVNSLQGGELKAAIVEKLGQPQAEEIRCSKDPNCSRKVYSLKYCFPDKAQCTDRVLLLLNEDGMLYRVDSNLTDIPAKFSAAHKPSWIE